MKFTIAAMTDRILAASGPKCFVTMSRMRNEIHEIVMAAFTASHGRFTMVYLARKFISIVSTIKRIVTTIGNDLSRHAVIAASDLFSKDPVSFECIFSFSLVLVCSAKDLEAELRVVEKSAVILALYKEMSSRMAARVSSFFIRKVRFLALFRQIFS